MGRTRDRASAAGLLPRMEARPWKDGKTVSYRYKPITGKPIALGTDKHAALQKVLELTGKRDSMGTLRWVWEQYTQETDIKGRPISTRWTKLTEGTRADYRTAWKQIDAVLGEVHIAAIDSTMVARYVHIERAASPRRADIEKSLLSRLFGHGIKLGVCKVNATIGVEPHGSEPNTVAPKDTVLKAFLEWLSKETPQRRIVGMAAEYASLAGNRQVEFRDLCWPQIGRAPAEVRREVLAGAREASLGEIRVKRAKQRAKKRGEVIEVIEISPAMDGLLDRLASLREERGVECLYVFPTRDNNAYTARGFKTLWQRCVLLAIEEKVIKKDDRFTFHDLRAYYTTIHKKQRGELPDLHKNKDVTARVYDRNTEVPRRSL
ncbi:MAG: integrase [Aquabacterium sp.]